MKVRRRILARTTGLRPYCVLFPLAAYRYHRAKTAPFPSNPVEV